MLHPVGPLPAAVYWRRRLLVLGLVLAVLGGGGWLAVALLSGGVATDQVDAAATGDGDRPAGPAALEQVVPSLAAVQVPTVPPATAEPEPEDEQPTAAGPDPGGPCGDDMISVDVRTSEPAVAVGSKPTLDLVVTNVSSVPCVRPLDKDLQEIVLLDSAGGRVWGSNDCFPEAGDDVRTLAPGEAVVFPVVWGGLTSSPGCASPRVPPAPGDYVLRGRLDTKTSGDTTLTLT